MGYPTIAEACEACAAFTFRTIAPTRRVGFRGIGRLGSYGNRVLVLLDGQPTNDNWVGSSYVGFDARTDLEDIERIEVVRGPVGALRNQRFLGRDQPGAARRRKTPRRSRGEESASTAAGSGACTYNLPLGATSASGCRWPLPEGPGATSTSPSSHHLAARLTGNARDVDGFKSGTVNGRLTGRPSPRPGFFTRATSGSPTGVRHALRRHRSRAGRHARPRRRLVSSPNHQELQLMIRASVNYYTSAASTRVA